MGSLVIDEIQKFSASYMNKFKQHPDYLAVKLLKKSKKDKKIQKFLESNELII